MLCILIFITSPKLALSQPKITFNVTAPVLDRITIGAVGDVLLHRPLQNKARRFGFTSLWQELLPYLRQSDINYANLEGPLATNINEAGRVIKGHQRNDWRDGCYTGFPLFNYHPSLAQELKKSGITIVSTANNHALDRYSHGIDLTIDNLRQAGLLYTGTRKADAANERFQITTKGKFTIAWIACTEMTNNIVDKHKQILHCYRKDDRAWILNKVKSLKNSVDAIIITPHWGTEYQHQPESSQSDFAKQVLDAGALIVIGSHPHVLQPLRKYITRDGRETLIMYSLGNFVSHQSSLASRSSIMLFVNIVKTTRGTMIQDVKFLPLFMTNRGDINNIKVKPIPIQQCDEHLKHEMARSLPLENGI